MLVEDVQQDEPLGANLDRDVRGFFAHAMNRRHVLYSNDKGMFRLHRTGALPLTQTGLGSVQLPLVFHRFEPP